MNKENCFIITGAPGSGKSAILHQLIELGYLGIAEPARQILAEQRCIRGSGIPDKNADLFIQLMLSRAIYGYRQIEETERLIFFDRGIPDNIAHAALYQINFESGWNAAKHYRYNSLVFFTPN
ncbi:MAG: AAA family ATPase [SAR324 cluster bacterium]|nr:AAA family ATPase [SAR324 cluster bacterium]